MFGKASSDRILQHAQTLVAELVADREVSLVRTKENKEKGYSKSE